MSAPNVSLLLAGGHPPPPSSFSPCRNLTRSSPHHLNSALVPRSLIRIRTETLATHSSNSVLVCSGIIGRTDRAKIKQNKQTNKDGKDKQVTKEGLQGLLTDNTNLRSFQELASANNSLFHYYFSDFLAKFFYNCRVNLLQILHLYMCCDSILSLV